VHANTKTNAIRPDETVTRLVGPFSSID
jgi:hypothetical protein